jgi:replicative DNA helicase
MTPKLTPHQTSDLAEQMVFGAILRDNEAMCDAAALLRENDFRTDAHRKLWSAMTTLFEANRPIDLPTLGELLQQRGQIEDLGGWAMFAHTLSDALEQVPTVYRVRDHARQVKDAALLRGVVLTGSAMIESAERPSGTATEVLESAERAIFALGEEGVAGQTTTMADVLPGVLDRLDARLQAPGVGGMGTGFMGLDVITGGMHDGELTILAARPSQGKTALGANIALHQVLDGRPVFVVSLEQANAELVERLLCAQAQVDSHKLRLGGLRAEDADRLAEGVGSLRRCGQLLFLDDRPHQTMLRIAANARRLKRRYGIALVVIDYLQLIEPENRRDPRHEQVGGISRRLKGLARELGVPVLALAQLNRGVEDRADQRPRLSDLRESGSIEADADAVLLLHHADPKEQGPTWTMDVIVAKNRNGRTGTATLHFRRDRQRFEDYALPEPQAPLWN